MYVKVFILFVFFCLYIEDCSTQNATEEADPIVTIINVDGYPAESYEVTTKDGYIVSLYRIPPKMNTSKVVFLMHGMIVSAIDFLILGPYENKALGEDLFKKYYVNQMNYATRVTFDQKVEKQCRRYLQNEGGIFDDDN